MFPIFHRNSIFMWQFKISIKRNQKKDKRKQLCCRYFDHVGHEAKRKLLDLWYIYERLNVANNCNLYQFLFSVLVRSRICKKKWKWEEGKDEKGRNNTWEREQNIFLNERLLNLCCMSNIYIRVILYIFINMYYLTLI